MKQTIGAWRILAVLATTAGLGAAEPFPVRIQVDAAQAGGELRPIWRFFGADEPNYATMPHGRKLLSELGSLRPNQVYFRTHNLLTSGDGTPALKWGSTGAYREDAQGAPVYDWKILDGIFDAYLERGVRPYVQIGFMPKDLSVRPEPYEHHWKPGDPYEKIYTGWAYPPKDYGKWGDLVFEWARHAVEKYGRREVETWYWQTWNEPDIPYWRGTEQEFHKLHDHAIAAVRRALPTARVGGPDTTGGAHRWLRRFLEHCVRGTNDATGGIGTPIDFISFHAKGAPRVVDRRVQMGIANQLRDIDQNFRVIASFPELRHKPVVIGESDPDGCAACSADVYPQNQYRNGPLYASYTAASFARKHELAELYGLNLEGALTWAFEFENQPYFVGFRTLASNGIDKPVMNVFRMFSRMTGRRVRVLSSAAVPLEDILREGVRGRPDVAALATLDGQQLSVMVWHYHDVDMPGPPAAVSLALQGLPSEARQGRLAHFRVDEEYSNAFTLWRTLGSPQTPTPEQYAQLERAGQLARFQPDQSIPLQEGTAKLELTLPRQSVSLLVLTW